jgi:hypothetical protein
MDMIGNWSRRSRRAALGALTLPLVAAACGPAAGSQSGATAGGGSQGQRLQVVIPSTDLAVGRNRVALGVLQLPRGQTSPVPLPDAQLTLKFFHPIEPQPVAKGEAATEFRYVADKTKGLYIAQVQFDQPGAWGVEVNGTAGGQALPTQRVQFQVKAKSDTPAIGQPAPRSRNLTRHDVDDIRKIDSGAKPNDMHEISIADALDQKRPLVVAFSTPGFCVTQTCAPQLGEVQQLKSKYGHQADFVHVEIFKDPMTRTPYETVKEWGLTSEPWTFLVDRDGLVADKFEGPAPVAELEPALQKLL